MRKFYINSMLTAATMLLCVSTAKADDGVIYLLGAQGDWTMSADAAVQLTETGDDTEIYYNESVTFSTGDYIAIFTQIDEDWGWDYRYAGYSGVTTLAPNTTSYLYNNTTLGWETSFYISTGGTYAVTVDMNELTILLYDASFSVDIPTQAYLLGNDGVWDPSTAAATLTETEEGSGIFTGTLEATANYFTIITELGESSDDWTTVNANRYGPSTDATTISAGETLEMSYGSSTSWYVETGTYTVTVDFNELTITLASGTNGIEAIKNGQTIETITYNLQGRKASAGEKGLLIKGGKKVIVK